MNSFVVKHITYLGCALSILEEGVFEPHSYQSKYNADNGLNLLTESRYNLLSHTGVTMVFEWRGDFQQVPIDYDYCNMKSNILYKQGAWRHFIKAPINKGNLRFIRLDIQNFKDLSDHIECLLYKNHFILSKLPLLFLYKHLYRREKYQLLKKIRNYRNLPISIRH